MLLLCRSRVLELSTPVVMGVLNVTPDSFSDGGLYLDPQVAFGHAARMVEEGAAIIDVGGESTRPGAAPVSESEELRRVLPVIERLVGLPTLISIDTSKPRVMREACAAGAALVNDVCALRQAGALAAVKESGAAVCLMHMQGEPRTMQSAPTYGDVVGEIGDFLAERLQACVHAGIAAERVVLDPGFGFGKSLTHNLQVLAGLERFHSLARPLLVGLSRKSMLGALTGLSVEQRGSAGVVAATLALWQGARIVRTHDVRATVEAVKLVAAVRQARAAGMGTKDE